MSGNQWLRLWHEMPNDPKWRTIARISGQPLALVQAAYIHLLVDASRNVTRGHATVTAEDLASALDCDTSQIEAILSAMQGRVLNGQELTGWDKRQPKREDFGNPETGAKSASERKRAERERKKTEAGKEQCHEASRNVTTDTDKDTDKREEQNLTTFGFACAGATTETAKPSNVTLMPPTPMARRQTFESLAKGEITTAYLEILGAAGALPISHWTATRLIKAEAWWRQFEMTPDGWREYLTCIRDNCGWMLRTHRGRDGTGRQPVNIDFVMTEQCYVNVAEGRYDEVAG